MKNITFLNLQTFPPTQKFAILEIITNDPETDKEVDLPYLRLR